MSPHLAPGKLMLAILMGLAVVASGCQQKTSRNTRNRIGRTGQPAGFYGANTPSQSGSGRTLVGEITNSNEQSFQSEMYYLTANVLSAGQELGYVSGRTGQSTGVVFWGSATIFSNGYGGMSGELDRQSAVLHIEIYDERAGQLGPVALHIANDADGKDVFVNAEGYVQGNQARLTFTNTYTSVTLQGTVSGQYFSGVISYSNSQSSGERTLGQFTVPTCGFFNCN